MLERSKKAIGPSSRRWHENHTGSGAGAAEVIRVAMGSMAGTIKDAVDDLRREGKKVGLSTLPVEHRIKIGRLIEALTGGTAMEQAMLGAGSPQAQRIMIYREGIGDKIRLAYQLAVIPLRTLDPHYLSSFSS